MASTQFISSATAGDQNGFGGQLVANAAQGLFAVGLASLGLGVTLASEDAAARNIQFDFQDTSSWDNRLDFNPLQRPIAAQGLYSYAAGNIVVENAAQGAAFDGNDYLQLGRGLISYDELARNVAFDLTQVQQAELALHFTFAGARVLSSVGGVGPVQFGQLEIETVAFAAPAGWESFQASLPVVSDDALARNVMFDFTIVQPAVLAQHFVFSGANVLVPGGWASLEVGNPLTENAAQGFFAQGWQSTRAGRAVFSDDALARNVTFDFVAVQEVSLPIQFVFGGDTRTAQFEEGLDSFTSGTSLVETPPLIEPVGWVSLEVGGLGKVIWLVYPQGIDSFTVGDNSAVGIPGQVFAQGSQVTVFGVPDLPRLVFAGMHNTAWGQTLMEAPEPPSEKTLEAPSFEATEVGTTFISNFWRVLDFDGLGAAGTSWGEGRLSFSPQHVQLPFDSRFFEPGQFRVGFGIEVEMIGVPPFVRFGQPIVDFARIFPSSISQTNWGSPDLANQDQAIFFDAGVRETQWGTSDVRTDLIIEVEYDCNENATRCGSTFSKYNLIENVNQTVRPNGFHSLRMEFFPLAVNFAGKAVQISGFNSLEFVPYWQGSHLIAYRNRSFVIGGYESLIFTKWSRAVNTARVLEAEGKQNTKFGIPDAERLLKIVFMWGKDSLQVSEIARTSFSPRGLDVKYPISSLRINQPFVAYGARYLEPAGLDSFKWAQPTVDGKPVPTLSPRWTQRWTQDQQLIGRPGVENFNKQFWPAGLLATQIPRRSAYWISHSPRFLEFEGLDATSYGRTVIEFRTKVLEPDGIDNTKYSREHNFWHDPPVIFAPIDQPAIFSGLDSLNMGFWGFLENVIHPEALNSLSNGDAFVHANSIIFELVHNPIGGYASYGEPVLTGGIRPVAPEVVGSEEEGSLEVGKPRINPFTIWCRNDTPQQAIRNHPGESWCDVDRFCGPGHPFNSFQDAAASPDVGPWFGWSRVDAKVTQNALITRRGNSLSARRIFFFSGEIAVSFGTNVFSMEGWLEFRAGFPVVLTVSDQESEIWKYTLDTKYGEPVVTDNGPRYVDPVGLSSLEVVNQQIENLNRAVHPAGFDATIYGSDTPPMVYHYPRGPEMAGEDLSLFGTQWISHSPRYFEVGDNKFFVTRWTVLARRMIVRNEWWIVKGYRFNEFFEFGDAAVQTGPNQIVPYSIYALCVSPWCEVKNDIV